MPGPSLTDLTTKERTMTTCASASRFADVNGASLFSEIARRAAPSALVLIHAGVADSRMWDDQFAAFARVGTVLRYDLRGHGRSTLPPGPFAHHDDLREVMRYVGISRAVLIGASMGGGVAAALAIAHPELVQGLVLVNSRLGSPGASDELRAMWSEVDALVARGDLDGANELELRAWVDGPRRDPSAVNAGVRERVREMNGALLARADEYEHAEERGLEPPAGSRLAEIQAPTLVIVGEMDQPDVIAAAGVQAACIAKARKVSIPDAAHLPSMEHPEVVNRQILEFVREL
jgi:pimeloyl-ACP methyl ester carboxylesterase